MNDRSVETSPSPQDPGSEDVSDTSAQPTSRWRRVARLTGLFTVVAAGSAIIGSAIGVSLSSPSPEASTAEERPDFTLAELWRKGVRHEVARPINVLLMGVDQVIDEDGEMAQFAGRSDTMLLVRLDPEDRSVNMLSIPRDTLVEFPGRSGVTKINHANFVGGPKLAADVINYNFQDVEVDRYVRFNTAALRELVDLLGGVDVFVPQDMYYVDQTQDLYIDLKAGQQRLNGEQAEQFARFRSDSNGDIGRVQRQQVLLSAMRDRLSSPGIVTKIPGLINLMRTQIDTNLSGEEILALTNFVLDVTPSDIDMVMVPGHFSAGDRYYASYWIPDPRGVNRVMQDYFQVAARPRLSEQVAERMTLTPDAVADSASTADLRRSLQIAVQNASEDPYSAQYMAQHLREQGFEQVYIISDWPTSQSQTQIIAQWGDLRGATMLERAIGLGNVVSTSTGDLSSDLTIRVGRDWASRLDI